MRVKTEESDLKSWVARVIAGAVLAFVAYYFLSRELIFHHLSRPALIGISAGVFVLIVAFGKPLYQGIYRLLHKIVY
jgi:hypothetical protein